MLVAGYDVTAIEDVGEAGDTEQWFDASVCLVKQGCRRPADGMEPALGFSA